MKISCNHVPCNHTSGWFKDRSIRCTRLEGLREGENEILLEIDYTHDMELEDVYIIGDFAVDACGRIAAEPGKLRFGDWCLQGYPHYAGSMIYHFAFNADSGRAKLRLGEVHAALVIARVNGDAPIYIPWRAANDVPVQLLDGENHIELEVVGTNRNLLGPLHQPYQLCSRIDWRDFRTEDGMNSEDMVLVPCGIFGQCYLLRD